MAGQGVALASIHMVKADLLAGRLQALTDFEPDGTHYVALSPRAFTDDARLLAFANWLTSVMEDLSGLVIADHEQRDG